MTRAEAPGNIDSFLEKTRAKKWPHEERAESSAIFSTDLEYSMEKIAELAELLPDRDIETFPELIMYEIRKYGVARFGVEGIVEWLNVLSKRNKHDELRRIVDCPDMKEITLPVEKYIEWGMKGIDWGNKKPGSLILCRPEVRTHSLLKPKLKEIAKSAWVAAHSGDHAAHRLFAILVLNWRSSKKRTMSKDKIMILANLLIAAYEGRQQSLVGDDGSFFEPEFMFQMLKREVAPQTYKAIHVQYALAIAEHLKHRLRRNNEIRAHVRKTASERDL